MRRRNIFDPIHVRVTGPGPLPFDMLRYDRACPRLPQDSVIALATLDRNYPRRMNSLELLCYSGPSLQRWQQFGWTCVVIEPDDAENADRATLAQIERALR